jgi:CRISPR-associated protein Cmr4
MSPHLIRKFARGAREVRPDLARLPGSPAMGACCVLNETLSIPGPNGRRVVFEDLDFNVDRGQEALLQAFVSDLGRILFPDGSADATDWRISLQDRICLVHDDMMSFLLETAMEVQAHIRLSNETKTVERGGLWYQESLPAESVLSGLVVAADVAAANGRSKKSAMELLDHVASLTKGLVQLGGKATTGQGSCFVRIGGES